MPRSRVYRTRPQTETTRRTRDRVLATVRELLDKGTFHAATVEEIADRAGVSRATLYQHFRSRAGLIDAFCDTFGANPAMIGIKRAHELEDPAQALLEMIENGIRFWASEEALHRHLYGLSVIDPAAAAFVERQQADRRSHLQDAVRRLRRAGKLRPDLS